MIALPQNQLGMWNIELVAQLSPARALNTVIRPQDLGTVGHRYGFIWLPAGMRGSERKVPRWMPVLCQEDVFETASKLIDRPDNLVTVGHR